MEKTKEYDEEPVKYCPRCYSLKIVYEDLIGSECCGDCGCSDIEEIDIHTWEKLYKNRYGHTFINTKKNIKNTPVFQYSISELKEYMFKCSSYMKIITELYPSFPKGLGKTDSLFLFFDKLIKDRKIDELKYLILQSH